MSNNSTKNLVTHKNTLKMALIFLSIFVIAELVLILVTNSGHFVFTLDDAYIHLALAENIAYGHYGLNLEDFSAPSSSIIWPFIIAPFAGYIISPYIILIINIVIAFGTVYIYWEILTPSPIKDIEISQKTNLFFTALLICLIFATNLIGLIFIGMEHSLQLFLCILMIWGVIYEGRHKKIPWWFIIAIILAPLVRYECLALSLPILIHLFLCGYRPQIIGTTLVMVLSIGLFTFFLYYLELGILPTSIVLKSSIGGLNNRVISVLNNFYSSINSDRGLLLTIVMLSLVYIGFFRQIRDKSLAIIIITAITLHLLVGSYGWYNRYEIYIWSVALLTFLYLNKTLIYQIPLESEIYQWSSLMIITLILICSPYIRSTIDLPVASNNIYEQQYQMHRFVTEYYNDVVAVHDIGYVSYLNNNYVVDLAGLASIEVVNYRKTPENKNWVSELMKKHEAKLTMVYDDWFAELMPDQWHKVGVLHTSKYKVTTARLQVSFYVADCDVYQDVYPLITSFADTLPQGVKFIMNEKIPTETCVQVTP